MNQGLGKRIAVTERQMRKVRENIHMAERSKDPALAKQTFIGLYSLYFRMSNELLGLKGRKTLSEATEKLEREANRVLSRI